MALVTQSIKNLKGGISQQPDILRYPEQGSQQINGWSSETEGLQKRPPSVFIKNLSGDLGAAPLIHLINRDKWEQYYVAFTGSTIRVFELNGTERTVSFPNGRVYITNPNPRENLRMVTVADYTFIVNRTVTVEQREGNLSYPGFRENGDALVNIRGGQYGRVLKVWVNGQQRAELQLPDGGDPKHSKQVDGGYIADQLMRQMKGITRPSGETPAVPDLPVPGHIVPLPGNWVVNVGTGYVQIVAPAGEDINDFRTDDGFASQLINPVTHYSQSFTKLPVIAPEGYLVKITGDTSKGSDAYYVTFDAKQKLWKETVGWLQPQIFRNSTMPWTLVRQADGNFVFDWHEWDARKAGDDDTNPFPSLVGSTINDVFFYRNRLGFLSGENVVMSQTGRYFNMFPLSVANLSDDDPLDVAVSHNRISILKYAVPFSEEMLLWSDQAQFVLTAQGVLSAKSAELDMTTEFDVSDSARPFGIGRGIHFAAPRASFTSISRYYAVQETSAVKSAEDVSKQVPRYIPNGVFSIAGSGTENFVSVLTSGAKSKVFIYKFLYQDEQLEQQSWSHWDFGPGVEVLAASSIGSHMYLILRNETDTFMSRVSFTKSSKDWEDEPYHLRLDMKKPITVPTGTYNDDKYETTFKPFQSYGTRFYHGAIYLAEHDGTTHRFDEPAGGWGGEPVVVVPGNWENRQLFCGFAIPFVYEFSKFLIKKTDDRGGVSTEDAGRLQLRRAWVNFEETGAFIVEVTNVNRTFTYDMSGNRLGSNKLVLGQLNLGTSQYRFPVQGNATINSVLIRSDYPTPLSIIGCGWEGDYNRRATGI